MSDFLRESSPAIMAFAMSGIGFVWIAWEKRQQRLRRAERERDRSA